MLPRHSRGGEVLQGALAAVPVIIGAVPFGLLFGALAEAQGLDVVNTMLMSLVVNSGSAQMIGLGMITSGAAWPLTVMTVLLINLRHVFYSAALAPYVWRMPVFWRAAIAFGMTDAVYALAAKVRRRRRLYLGEVSRVQFGPGHRDRFCRAQSRVISRSRPSSRESPPPRSHASSSSAMPLAV
ncbi:AzlC family ABC transporter permease [Streptomyces antarcticus]|uniref:AzlC family ABC transporter permease n=1 Tax=Streptomyces antarcticus TaxID=2996458 RepID=UPI002272003C|nr:MULTISPECIES: AzlC family ABC transporter permease [unclassified Streptomyces]MCY0944486.1 AzlC family ABC transporter permease [Streptomyces sp. H34-AA3]MCZ4087009.1 AzlC family ABC transporter permease [Streptomyces sp. H34-S5]